MQNAQRKKNVAFEMVNGGSRSLKSILWNEAHSYIYIFEWIKVLVEISISQNDIEAHGAL